MATVKGSGDLHDCQNRFGLYKVPRIIGEHSLDTGVEPDERHGLFVVGIPW